MTNPYLQTENCVDRLYKQWQKHPRLIVAVDFDSTLSPLDASEEHIDYSDTINALKRAQKHNFFIVVYSCSNTDRYDKIHKYLAQFGLKVSAINSNIIDLGFEPQAKIYYNILLDDKAGLGQSIEILNKLIDKIEEIEVCWPTLKGRLANPITTEKQAVDQMMQICPEIANESIKKKFGYE